MSHQVTVPPLDGSDTFVVEQYYVALNDAVAVGQPFALVRSECWAWDVPATTNGIVSALVAEPGSTVTVGAPLLEIREQGTEDQEQAEQSQRIKRPSLVEEPQTEPILAQLRVRATPVARRMIAAYGLDPAALIGTGRGKVITRADVLAVVENAEQGIKNTEQTVTFAEENEHAAQIAPDGQSSIRNGQFSHPSNLPYALTAIEADLATALATIAQHQTRWARRGVTISTTACVAAATVAALGEHRLLNSAWSDDGIILCSRVHLQIEQPTLAGMQTTLVPDAADLNLVGLARRLAHAVHQEKIEQQAATFVIVEHAAPWWAHALPTVPSTAQLGVGAIMQQPRVVATAYGDQIMVRPTMVLTLAYDARLATQPDADALLCAIKQRLEHLHSL